MRRLYPQDPDSPYQECKNPGCDRVVRLRVAFCCEDCRERYEVGDTGRRSGPADHSDMCWVRHEQRRHEGYRVK